MNTKVVFLVIVLLVGASLWGTPAAYAADRCPTPTRAFAAQVDVLGTDGTYYLIDPLTQGLPAHTDNVAHLAYAARPARWVVGGVKVVPAWQFKYHITYFDNNWQPVGDAWFATLVGYDAVYFYFVMPADEPDHPRCGYGSGRRDVVDALMRPRR